MVEPEEDVGVKAAETLPTCLVVGDVNLEVKSLVMLLV